MKNTDLLQFQFDYDLTWSAFFMNADGTIYGRYGTRSGKNAMSHNSLKSLENALKRAYEMHQNYPKNRESLIAKRGDDPKFRKPSEIPGLQKHFAKQLNDPVGPRNCLHCHNIHDGLNITDYEADTFDLDRALYRFPLPENIGVKIEIDSGNEIEQIFENSFAEKSGLKIGDVIATINDQSIISQADIQWVLHNLNDGETLKIGIDRDGKKIEKMVTPIGNWRHRDASWRASMWGIPPRVGLHSPELNAKQKRKLGIDPDQLAVKVKWIPNKKAVRAGLKNGDVIVQIGDATHAMNNAQLHLWIKQRYKLGDEIPIKVLRGDRKIDLVLPMPNKVW